VRIGRDGDPPLGLVLDSTGCHFDASKPSDLEHMLQHHPLDDPHPIERATAKIRRIQHSRLSKYNAFEPTTAPSVTDYALVIDQTFNDAALRTSGANAAPFHQMLAAAKRDYPDSKILIKAHAETISGHHLVISAPPMKPMMFRFCPSQHPLGGCVKAQKRSIRILPKWALKPS
jgi:capsular polysaccharide export protein